MENGIMTTIHALVGDSCEPHTKHQERHPYYKRAGRGHNRDNCDACGECGDILCCDTCPASFHWDCSDPPLEEEEIPLGAWQCRSCKFLKKMEPVVDVEVPPEQVDVPETREVSEAETPDVAKVIRDVFAELIPQTDLLNPKQFVLPPDFQCFDYSLPGSSRTTLKKPVSNKARMKIIEVDPPKVMKHTAICFVCDVSGRSNPLLKCDSCSKYFHLDCLDPPLTTLPSGIWLCPLHPDPILEMKRLKSSCLSERVRIWEETHRPVDHFSTTLKFLTTVHRSRPTFLAGTRATIQRRVKVPGAVKMSYADSRDLGNGGGIAGSAYNFRDVAQQARINAMNLELLAHAASICNDNLDEKMLDNFGSGNNVDTMQIAVKEEASITQSASAGEKLEQPKIMVKPESDLPNSNIPEPTNLEPSLALLCVNNATKLEFYGSSVSVGRGSEVTLDISKCSPCRRISSRHALIYYDNVCMRWELLNYCSSGTFVNNCLYGCTSTRTAEANSVVPAHDQILKDFKDIVDKRRKVLTSDNIPNLKRSWSALGSLGKECRCMIRKSLSDVQCWEGPAALQIGDRIQMGCVKLIVVAASSR